MSDLSQIVPSFLNCMKNPPNGGMMDKIKKLPNCACEATRPLNSLVKKGFGIVNKIFYVKLALLIVFLLALILPIIYIYVKNMILYYISVVVHFLFIITTWTFCIMLVLLSYNMDFCTMLIVLILVVFILQSMVATGSFSFIGALVKPEKCYGLLSKSTVKDWTSVVAWILYMLSMLIIIIYALFISGMIPLSPTIANIVNRCFFGGTYFILLFSLIFFAVKNHLSLTLIMGYMFLLTFFLIMIMPGVFLLFLEKVTNSTCSGAKTGASGKGLSGLLQSNLKNQLQSNLKNQLTDVASQQLGNIASV